MKKKIFSVMFMLIITVLTFTNIYATTEQLTMFDFKAYEDIYRLSEDEAGINLPFINFFSGAAIYDKDINHSGITIGDSTVEIDEKLEGLHIIFSTDMITVKGEVEHALIYGNNVVISGKVTGDTMLIGNTVTITKTADIDKDLIIIADKLNIEGNVDGNVIATVAIESNISGTIGKDLRTITKKIDLSNSNIVGNVYVETETEESKITNLYESAKVYEYITEEPVEQKTDVMAVVTKGVITVVVYTLLCYLINKKENNFIDKAYVKFKDNAVFGILISFAIIMSVILVPILLILLAIFGLGIIAWPILVVYVAVLLFTLTTSSLIVGLTIYSAVKKYVGKYKVIVMVGIFAVLYALSQIPVISYYTPLVTYLIALAVIVTMVTKKIKPVPSDVKEVKEQE